MARLRRRLRSPGKHLLPGKLGFEGDRLQVVREPTPALDPEQPLGS